MTQWGLSAAIWAAVAGLVVVGYYAYDLPDITDLAADYRTPGLTVTAADGAVIASYGAVFAGQVTLDDLPTELPAAVIATEDRRFYRHFGIDLWGILRASVANLRAGRVVQGGSTLTQQIAKNVFLTPARTLRRKMQELLLALWLEAKFTKDQLLTIYLNRVYLGAGSHGVEAAARRYFGRGARDLTLAQSAMIAGLLKAPSRYAPTNDLAAAQARAGRVLDNMVAAGLLAPARAAAAKARPAPVTGTLTDTGSARYFADWIAEQVSGYAGPAAGDLVVETTFDAGLQRAAAAAVAAILSETGAAARASQAALVALDRDGAVRAMVGGRSYAASQFNRVTQAQRQPGSAFKLLVYLAGLEAGLRPDDVFTDGPIEVDGWSPRNYGGDYAGDMSLRQAFARSTNTVAVRVAERAGRDRVVKLAHRLGVTTPLNPAPSLALGAAEVNLLELTGAYAAVANGGHGVFPYGIREIRGRDGTVLYRRQGTGAGPVLDRAVVAAMDGLLRAVVSDGTGRAARLPGGAAGKTGTSQDSRDAWFIGYAGDLVAGVWLGNDDSSPMKGVTGGGLPAQLWHDFMTRAGAG